MSNTEALTIEIKKFLYKENPVALLQRIKKGIVYYESKMGNRPILFEIPIDDIKDADFLRNMDSKLLIRWLVVYGTENQSENDQ